MEIEDADDDDDDDGVDEDNEQEPGPGSSAPHAASPSSAASKGKKSEESDEKDLVGGAEVESKESASASEELLSMLERSSDKGNDKAKNERLLKQIQRIVEQDSPKRETDKFAWLVEPDGVAYFDELAQYNEEGLHLFDDKRAASRPEDVRLDTTAFSRLRVARKLVRTAAAQAKGTLQDASQLARNMREEARSATRTFAQLIQPGDDGDEVPENAEESRELKDMMPAKPRNWNREFQGLVTKLSTAASQDELAKLASEFMASFAEVAVQIVMDTHVPPNSPARKIKAGRATEHGVEYAFPEQNVQFVLWDMDTSSLPSDEVRATQALLDCDVSELRTRLVASFLVQGRSVSVIATDPAAPLDGPQRSIVYGFDESKGLVRLQSAAAEMLMRRVCVRMGLAPSEAPAPRGGDKAAFWGPLDMHVQRGTDGHYYAANLGNLLPNMPPRLIDLDISDVARSETGETAITNRAFSRRRFRPELLMRYMAGTPMMTCNFGELTPSSAAEASYAAAVKLHRDAIPMLVDDLGKLVEQNLGKSTDKDDGTGVTISLTTDSISGLFHNAGVNLRLMGLVRAQSKSPSVRRSLLEEMVVRTLKRMLRGALFDKDPKKLEPPVCELTRVLFLEVDKDAPAAKKKRVASKSEELWKRILPVLMQEYYGWEGLSGSYTDLKIERDLAALAVSIRGLYAKDSFSMSRALLEPEIDESMMAGPDRHFRVRFVNAVMAVRCKGKVVCRSLRSVEDHLLLARSWVSQKRDAGVPQSPDHVPVMWQIMHYYRQPKEDEPVNFDEVAAQLLETLRITLKFNPPVWRSLRYASEILLVFGRVDEGIALLEDYVARVVSILPAHHALISFCYINAAYLLLLQKRPDLAARFVMSATEHFYTRRGAERRLAQMLAGAEPNKLDFARPDNAEQLAQAARAEAEAKAQAESRGRFRLYDDENHLLQLLAATHATHATHAVSTQALYVQYLMRTRGRFHEQTLQEAQKLAERLGREKRLDEGCALLLRVAEALSKRPDNEGSFSHLIYVLMVVRLRLLYGGEGKDTQVEAAVKLVTLELAKVIRRHPDALRQPERLRELCEVLVVMHDMIQNQDFHLEMLKSIFNRFRAEATEVRNKSLSPDEEARILAQVGWSIRYVANAYRQVASPLYTVALRMALEYDRKFLRNVSMATVKRVQQEMITEFVGRAVGRVNEAGIKSAGEEDEEQLRAEMRAAAERVLPDAKDGSDVPDPVARALREATMLRAIGERELAEENREGAMADFKEALELLDDDEVRESGGAEADALLLKIYGHLGDEESEHEVALRMLRSAEVHPEEPRKLVNALLNVASTKYLQHDSRKAERASHVKRASDLVMDLLKATSQALFRQKPENQADVQRALQNAMQELDLLRDLFQAFKSLGDKDSCERVYRECFALGALLYQGPNVEMLLPILDDGDWVFEQKGDYKSRAEVLMQKISVLSQVREDPQRNIRLAVTYFHLGQMLLSMREGSGAQSALLNAIRFFASVSADTSFEIAACLRLLAVISSLAGQRDDARAQLAKATETLLKSTDPRRVPELFLICQVLLSIGDVTTAVSTGESALAEAEKQGGEAKLMALEQLASLYGAINRREPQIKMLNRLVEATEGDPERYASALLLRAIAQEKTSPSAAIADAQRAVDKLRGVESDVLPKARAVLERLRSTQPRKGGQSAPSVARKDAQ